MKSLARNISALTILCACGHSSADVIYSGLQDIPIPLTYAGVQIDVDSDTIWDLNPYLGGVYLANNSAFQPARDGTGGMDTVNNYVAGDLISSSLLYATGMGGSIDHLGSTFTAGQEGYLGFKLGSNYGYMRVVFTNNTDSPVVPVIKEWAYDTSGASIAVANVKRVGDTVALDSSQGSFTLSSPINNISGTTNLLKTGSGTITLTGANTYTGITTVSDGDLVINGSLANSFTTVENTANLRGNGVITGPVTIEMGGTLAAGAIGIQSLATGELSLLAGSTFNYEMNSDADSSEASDLMAVTGNLNLDSDNDFQTLAILQPSDSGLSGWTAGEKFTLISYSGSWDGGHFYYLNSAVADDSTIAFGGMNWLINYNDTSAGTNFTDDLTAMNRVTMLAVPETSASLLGAIGALFLLRRRRK